MNELQHANLSAYIEQAQSVIEWNAIKYAGGAIPFSDQIEIENQIGYTKSEAQEIIEGIKEKNAREVLDGVCDTFVTAAFMIPLTRKDKDGIEDHSKLLKAARHAQSWAQALPTLDKLTVNSLLEGFANSVIANANDTVSAMKLCYLLDVLGIDVTGAIDAVMQSNWSKYPRASELNRTPEDECRWIETNRNVTDVRHIEFGGRLIFRNKMGSGKIMKPSLFAEPVFRKSDIDLLEHLLFDAQ